MAAATRGSNIPVDARYSSVSSWAMIIPLKLVLSAPTAMTFPSPYAAYLRPEDPNTPVPSKTVHTEAPSPVRDEAYISYVAVDVAGDVVVIYFPFANMITEGEVVLAAVSALVNFVIVQELTLLLDIAI